MDASGGAMQKYVSFIRRPGCTGKLSLFETSPGFLAPIFPVANHRAGLQLVVEVKTLIYIIYSYVYIIYIFIYNLHTNFTSC